MVRSAIPSQFTVKDRIRGGTEGRVQSTIPSMALQVLIMAQSCIEFFENNGEVDGATWPDRAGDGARHHFLHGPSWSLISYRGWSRVLAPVTYQGAKHHGADLSYAKFIDHAL